MNAGFRVLRQSVSEKNVRKIMMEQKYYEEQDRKNIEKIRNIQEQLPAFCKAFFHDIADYTSTRTRVAYAYDLKVFF